MTKLRKHRQTAGLTQAQLAELSGVAQQQISFLEIHGCRRYSLATIRLGLVLGVPPEALIEGSADSGPASPGPAVAASRAASHA
jgi:transcriptional regulator with XRE-family HTH domain